MQYKYKSNYRESRRPELVEQFSYGVHELGELLVLEVGETLLRLCLRSEQGPFGLLGVGEVFERFGNASRVLDCFPTGSYNSIVSSIPVPDARKYAQDSARDLRQAAALPCPSGLAWSIRVSSNHSEPYVLVRIL